MFSARLVEIVRVSPAAPAHSTHTRLAREIHKDEKRSEGEKKRKGEKKPKLLGWHTSMCPPRWFLCEASKCKEVNQVDCKPPVGLGKRKCYRDDVACGEKCELVPQPSLVVNLTSDVKSDVSSAASDVESAAASAASDIASAAASALSGVFGG